MNSLKRFEYCSGFTVEISAPAWNTQDMDSGQMLKLNQKTGRRQLRGTESSGAFLFVSFSF